MIAGIVLAAGRSTRLGRPKQLLPVRGEPLLHLTLRNVLASSLDAVLAVVEPEADAIREAVADLPVELVFNPDAAQGQSTSLIAGLQALPPETEAAMILLGDQPGVAPRLIDALIAAWRETRASVVAPTYLDGVGNPVLFDRSIFPELAALIGDVGARSVVRAYEQAGKLQLVSMDSLAPPDVDTEADYAALVAYLRNAPLPARPDRGR